DGLTAMGATQFAIADLDGLTLGLEAGSLITLDATASGWGWFVDPTSVSGTAAAGMIDLLTVVSHELGHVAGFAHENSGVMQPTPEAGARELPPVGALIDPLAGGTAASSDGRATVSFAAGAVPATTAVAVVATALTVPSSVQAASAVFSLTAVDV